MSDHFSK